MALKMDDDRVNQLVQQWLNERGYQVALLSLQQESGVQVTSPCSNFLPPSLSPQGARPLQIGSSTSLQRPRIYLRPVPSALRRDNPLGLSVLRYRWRT